MKKIILSAIICIFSLAGFSQNPGFPITYSLSLFRQDTVKYYRSDPDYIPYKEGYMKNKKRASSTITFTKLDYVKLVNIYQTFIKHVEVKKTVNSYHYYYTHYATGIDLWPGAIKDYSDPTKYKIFNDYSVELKSDVITWNNGYADGMWGKLAIHANGKDNYVTACDTTSVQFPYPPYESRDTVICRYSGPGYTEGLGFTEVWNMDPNTGNFDKKIDFLSLNVFRQYLGGYDRITLMSFDCESNPGTKYLKENMKYDVFFDEWVCCNPYETYDNCYSIIYQLSGYESTRDNINAENRTILFTSVFNAVEQGKLIPLEAALYDKGKEKTLSIDKMYDCMKLFDKMQIEDPKKPGKMKDTVITSYIRFSDIVGIRFIEDWSFEAEPFNFYKKVKTFALLVNQYDPKTGELIGYKSLFYLKPKN